MNSLRWILVLPVAAVAALASGMPVELLGFMWGLLVPKVVFDIPKCLIFGEVFVSIGARVAPHSKILVAGILTILATAIQGINIGMLLMTPGFTTRVVEENAVTGVGWIIGAAHAFYLIYRYQSATTKEQAERVMPNRVLDGLGVIVILASAVVGAKQGWSWGGPFGAAAGVAVCTSIGTAWAYYVLGLRRPPGGLPHRELPSEGDEPVVGITTIATSAVEAPPHPARLVAPPAPSGSSDERSELSRPLETLKTAFGYAYEIGKLGAQVTMMMAVADILWYLITGNPLFGGVVGPKGSPERVAAIWGICFVVALIGYVGLHAIERRGAE